MSDIKPTRRAVLIATASTAVATIMPMPSKASPRWSIVDDWDAAVLEGYRMVMEPSAADLLEPIVEGELEQGELLAERLMSQGRIPKPRM